MAQKIDGGEVDIKVTASTDDLEKNIDKAQKTAKKAGEQIAKDAGKAENGIEKMGGAAKKTGEQIDKFGDHLGKAGEAFEGLGKAAQESAQKMQMAAVAVEDAAVRQIAAIQSEEREKLAAIKTGEDAIIAELTRSVHERTALLEAEKGRLDKAAYNEKLEAIRREEQEKTGEIKRASAERVALVKKEAERQVAAVREGEKKQLEEIKKSNKSKTRALKDFAKGFSQNMLGIDGVMAAVAGGPVAIGNAAANMGKQAVAALNEMAEMYRKSEQLEYALETAVHSNPYINGSAVQGLKDFAKEVERTSMLDGDQILAVETRLASMGQSAEQIKKIVQTAADIDARGLMDFESAATNLARSTFGMAGTLGRINSEVAAMSTADLRAGKAIDALAEKVRGAAGAAMATGAGQAKLFNTEVDNLKKNIGEQWENATASARTWLTDLIAKANEALTRRSQLAGDQRAIDNGTATAEQELRLAKEKLDLLEKNVAMYDTMNKQQKLSLNLTDKFISDQKARLEEQKQEVGRLTRKLEAQQRAEQEAAGKQRDLAAETAAANTRAENDKNAQKMLDDNAARLKTTIDAILREAELLRQDADSLEVKGKILQAEIDAYDDLINNSGGLITGNLKREQNRWNDLKKRKAEYDKAVKEAEDAESINKAVEQFKEAYADILAMTTDTVTLVDEKEVNAALNAFKRLEDGAKKLLVGEGKLIQDLAIKNAAEQFKQTHADVLALTTDTITTADEAAVTSALNAFKQLEDGAKELLTGEGKHIQDLASEVSLISSDGSLVGDLITSWKEAGRIIDANWKLAIGDMDAATRTAVQGMITSFSNFATTVSNTWTDLSGAYGEYQKAVEDERIADAQAEIEVERKADQERLENGLITNEELEKAEESRAQREQQLKRETALAEYKLALNQWQNSLVSATVQGSLATIKAFSEGGPYAGPILAAMIAITTGLQIATISKTKPRVPTFHSGGIVRGEGEVGATLLGGEVVETRQQFQNQMAIQSRLAAAMVRGGSTGVSVNIANYGAAVSDPKIDGNNIRITIAKTVNDLMANGGLESGMAGRNRYVGGIQLETL
jgi:peroxiredoxin